MEVFMLAIVVGLLFVSAGFWGIIKWWPFFFSVIKGLGPFMILVGGLLAVVAGFTGIRDSSKNNKKNATEESK